MKVDLSKQLYDKYFKLTNRKITVTLKNSRMISGVLIAFFCNDGLLETPYITKWHIVDEKDKWTLGTDACDVLLGEYIKQNDIAEIKFHQDNSLMQFEK